MESSDFTQVVTTAYRADLVVLPFKGEPVFAIAVEAQLSRDDEKRASWPLYLTSLRARMRCPTVLLVVAPNPAVARWCARPIELGHPGFVLQPLVAGPSAIPLILGKQVAGQDPELAVLSALAHGRDAKLAPGLLEAVVSSAQRHDNERLSFYIDLAVSAFGEAARSALEAFMQSGSYQYQSGFVRKLVAHGLEKGSSRASRRGFSRGSRKDSARDNRKADWRASIGPSSRCSRPEDSRSMPQPGGESSPARAWRGSNSGSARP